MPIGSVANSSAAERRKHAVALRLQKKSLNEIQESTGLSHPTIIAAYKKFLSGGWSALNEGMRGRPSNSTLISDDLSQLLLNEMTAPQNGNHPLWSGSYCHQRLAERTNGKLSERSVRRYLNEHKILPSDEVHKIERSSVLHWLQQHHTDFIRRVDTKNLAIFICGIHSFNLHRKQVYLIYLRDLRNRIYWQCFNEKININNLLSFLKEHSERQTQPTALLLKVPFMERYPELISWQKPNCQQQLISHQTFCNALEPPTDSSLKTNQSSSNLGTPTDRLTTGITMPLTHLQRLEAESIQIMREVVAETDNPVMLYSIGKDSAVMLHIAMKAFYPSLPPFPLLHVDTRWKFREMYSFRDKMVDELGLKLISHINPEGVEKEINPFTHGSAIHTDIMKTEGLKQALNKYGFDAAFGGARRDEEKSRAKERIFSFRTADHRWDPKSQRPEIWKLYNARKHKGESIRVFPISNWTELDIWQYIHLENIPIVPLYYSAERPVVERDGTLIMVDDERMPLREGEIPMMKKVRFRTLGCYPLTGAVESEAATLPEIIQEMLLTKTSERQGRMIDHDSAASMEKKKQEGYF